MFTGALHQLIDQSESRTRELIAYTIITV